LKRHFTRKFRVLKAITGDIAPMDIVRLKRDWGYGLKKGDCLIVQTIPADGIFPYVCLRYAHAYSIDKDALEVIGWIEL